MAGAGLAHRQHVLRNRVEKKIETDGFDERYMAKTTDEWCNRQTARVVCERFDLLEDYVELCDEQSETARLTWIPHF